MKGVRDKSRCVGVGVGYVGGVRDVVRSERRHPGLVECASRQATPHAIFRGVIHFNILSTVQATNKLRLSISHRAILIVTLRIHHQHQRQHPFPPPIPSAPCLESKPVACRTPSALQPRLITCRTIGPACRPQSRLTSSRTRQIPRDAGEIPSLPYRASRHCGQSECSHRGGLHVCIKCG